ncbi:MAG: hypothetical protein AB1813_00650 [Verrucomicrobiota bacterium]|jgi:hypothetical protein
MSVQPDHDFKDLQVLLSLKGRETPPPGYFNRFSQNVIARLERDDAVEYSSWWTSLVRQFDAKPILVCAYSCVVSGLLLLGFKISHVFAAETASLPTIGNPWGLAATSAGGSFQPPLDHFVNHVVDHTAVNYAFPTRGGVRFNSQSSLNTSLFRIQPASYSISY